MSSFFVCFFVFNNVDSWKSLKVFAYWILMLEQWKSGCESFNIILSIKDLSVKCWSITDAMWQIMSIKERNSYWGPTIVAVWLVIMLGVRQSQYRVGATRQAWTPTGRFPHTSSTPQLHGPLWWCHGLVVSIQVLDCTNREAVVGKANVRTERQAAAWWRLTDP